MSKETFILISIYLQQQILTFYSDLVTVSVAGLSIYLYGCLWLDDQVALSTIKELW